MKKQVTILLVIVIVFLTFYSVYYYSNYRVSHVPLVKDAKELDSTAIISSWQEGDLNQNLLFSPGLSMAFNNFRDSFPALKFKTSYPVDPFFTQNPASLEGFSNSKFLVGKSGKFNDTTLSQINRLENRQLNNSFEFHPPWQKGEWFIFSHYYFPVLFKNTFQLSREPLDFEGKKVHALVTLQNAQKESKQFRVYQKTATQFALEYRTSENGKLVMAMLPPQRTLKQTYEQVHGWLSGNEGKPFKEDEGILLPVMDFYLTNNLTDTLRTSDGRKAVLNACQRISYSMNAEYSFLTSEGSQPSLKFDRPFLVYHIPPEAETPLFVMWVENPEILMPFEQPG